MKVLTVVLVLLFSFSAWANRNTKVIKFDEEDLARESVLPTFKNQVAVRKKNVPKDSRFELGLQVGNQLTEAFYDPYTLSLSAHYHFSEFNAIEISYYTFSTSKSQFVDILNEDVPSNNFDFNNAPTVDSMLLGSWEFTPYYGKISLTKQTVMNLSVYTNFNIGMVDNGQSSVLAYGFGLGQKLYFSPNWGLRIELKGLFYDVVNPLTTTSTFKEENKFNLMLNVGLLTMLPFL